MYSYPTHQTYGFRFKGDHQQRVAGLHSIGKELRSDQSYKWNGLERSEHGRIVFQYTLDGTGAINIGDQIHELKKGDAFFITIPSDHIYYFPESATKWEFAFITLYGDETFHHYEEIIEQFGHIIQLSTHSRPIKHILRMLEIIETTGIKHGYEASGYGYSFMMELRQYLEYDQPKEENLPVAIAKAVTYMQEHFALDIALDDIVAASGLSKYHFTRLFSTTLKETPIHYLTKIRLERALELLQHTDKSIEEIAQVVGYSTSNYFSKVFKNVLNETPSNYRQNKSRMPVDRLFIE